jgi:8-oxo-dGTP diphosphatase
MNGEPVREFGSRVAGISYVDRPGAYAFLPDNQQRLAVVRTGVGLFLPGGGIESGEDALSGLKREVFEEIGYTIHAATVRGQAAQFHWSEFYQAHFKKIGTFYLVQATAPAQPIFQQDHSLIWMPPDEAALRLTQEFQRWAVSELYS